MSEHNLALPKSIFDKRFLNVFKHGILVDVDDGVIVLDAGVDVLNVVPRIPQNEDD